MTCMQWPMEMMSMRVVGGAALALALALALGGTHPWAEVVEALDAILGFAAELRAELHLRVGQSAMWGA